MSKHTEHARKAGVSVPCTAHHVNFGGGCLNCGYIPPGTHQLDTTEAENARLRKALEGVLHHNAAVKPQYRLPASLIRHIKQALEDKP